MMLRTKDFAYQSWTIANDSVIVVSMNMVRRLCTFILKK